MPTASLPRIAAAAGCSASTARRHLAGGPADLAARGTDPRRRGAYKAAPKQLLRTVADPDQQVRWWAAANHTCPQVQARLAVDPDPDVRSKALSNAACPAPVLLRAVLRGGRSHRAAAASNPRLQHRLLERLSSDRYRDVRAAAVAASMGLWPTTQGGMSPVRLEGASVVFTGSFAHFGRRTIEQAAREAGAYPDSKVGTRTSFLVAGRPNPKATVGPTGRSSKRRAADDYRIPVLDEDAFIRLLPEDARRAYMAQD